MTRNSDWLLTSTAETWPAFGASAEALEYGIVGINTGIISTEVAPFRRREGIRPRPRRLQVWYGRVPRNQIYVPSRNYRLTL